MAGSLTVTDIVAGYGATVVLDGLSLAIEAGDALAVLGRNGVGKSTLLATIMGHTTLHRGSVRFDAGEIARLPVHRRARAGLGYVPQEREIFPSLSVEENLMVAARGTGWSVARVFDLFPGLAARRRNGGAELSGGEQQMLSIGRALMGDPKLLLMDEPLEGLAPVIVDGLLVAIERLNREAGLTIVLVEQSARRALSVTRSAVVLDRGRIVHRGPSAALRDDPALLHRLMGVASAAGQGRSTE